MHASDEKTQYLPARQVWERYGVTTMSLHRWVNDPSSGFPKPTYLGRFRYWRLDELEAWERSCPRGVTRASAFAAANAPETTA